MNDCSICKNYEPETAKMVGQKAAKENPDVVQVVRCKDCVYYNSDSEECLDEMGYARAWRENDYCSYGRKEGEE